MCVLSLSELRENQFARLGLRHPVDPCCNRERLSLECVIRAWLTLTPNVRSAWLFTSAGLPA
nr:hypothetical protein [Plesiomonas shigelloides]